MPLGSPRSTQSWPLELPVSGPVVWAIFVGLVWFFWECLQAGRNVVATISPISNMLREP